MTRTAWFHCFAGVAGDMLLGALLDAGADVDEVRRAIGGLGVHGWSLEVEQVTRQGLRAGRAVVAVDEHHGDAHGHRPYREIEALLVTADLGQRVRDRARAVFAALAAAEGSLHGVPPDDVEFHEVGSLDAVVDVVGTCAALESLGVDRIVCSPISVGMGTFTAAHGTLPNPAPAVGALAARFAVPVHGIDEPLELATPTGVALMAALATSFGPVPTGVVRAAGLGAGGRDPSARPNVVQVLIVEDATISADEEQLVVLETNVDDVSGEVLAHTVTLLLAAGARDAWITPIVMKKGRPAHTVHALCAPPDVSQLRDVLVDELGTLGVRAAAVGRWAAPRTIHVVQVDGHDIRVKRGPARAKAEFDDAAAAASALGRPVRDVIEAAEREA